MADVLQSRSPCSVPVGLHLSPLYPHLMYLPLLLRSPVQHTVAKQGSLLRTRDVENWQLFVDRGVNCARLAWFFAGHHRFWWCTFIPCLPALVRVIIITVVVPASLSTSRPAYAFATCAGAAAITCSSCSTAATTGCRLFTWFAPAGATCATSGLLAYCGAVCQFQTLAVREVFVPLDFRHGDLLPVLLLEIGNKFPHLVGTPTSSRESFLQGSSKPVVNKESCEGLSCGHMGWAGWQSQVYLFLHPFRCLCSLHLLGVIFVQTLIRRVLQHHLSVRSSPRLRVLLRVALSSSSSHC